MDRRRFAHKSLPGLTATPWLSLAALLIPVPAPAQAGSPQSEADMAARIEQLEHRLQAQESRIQAQQAELQALRRGESPSWLDERQADELKVLVAEAMDSAEQVHGGAGWDVGRFFLESADGDYQLNIGGRVQPRYEFRSRSEAEDTSSFFLRRIRLDLRGHMVDPRLTFRIMPEMARSATLRDGWVNYEFAPMFQVRAGQFTVPFQWHRYVSGSRQHFTERGMPSETFGFPTGYDIGVGLHGRNDAETFSYGVGFFDGAGRNVRDSNSAGHMASGRLTWAAMDTLPRDETDHAWSARPQLTFGAGLQAANRNEVRAWDLGRSPVGNERADWITGTTDVSLRWGGFSVVADGYLRGVNPDDPAVDSYTGWAYMVSAGYFLVPERFEVVGRYSELMLDRRDDGTRRTEWGLGMNLYHHGHRWKTQINYFNQHQSPGTEHVFLIQHHLQF